MKIPRLVLRTTPKLMGNPIELPKLFNVKVPHNLCRVLPLVHVNPLFFDVRILSGSSKTDYETREKAKDVLRTSRFMLPDQLNDVLEQVHPWAVTQIETLGEKPDPVVIATLELLVETQILIGNVVRGLNETSLGLLIGRDRGVHLDAMRLYTATIRSGYMTTPEVESGVRQILATLDEKSQSSQLTLLWEIGLLVPWMKNMRVEMEKALSPFAQHLSDASGFIRTEGVLALHALEDLRERLNVHIPNGGTPWPKLWEKYSQVVPVPDHIQHRLNRLGMQIEEWMDPATDIRRWAHVKLDSEKRRDLRLVVEDLADERWVYDRLLPQMMNAMSSFQDRLGFRARLEEAMYLQGNDSRRDSVAILRATLLGYGDDTFRANRDLDYLSVVGGLSGSDIAQLRGGEENLDLAYRKKWMERFNLEKNLRYWHREVLHPQTLMIDLPIDIRRLVMMNEMVHIARGIPKIGKRDIKGLFREMVREIQRWADGPPGVVEYRAKITLKKLKEMSVDFFN